MIKTVIFDMDGTLIDTEKYYRECWPKAMAAFGFEMSDAQALEMRSMGRPFAPIHLKKVFGESLDYHQVRNKRKELVEECIRERGIQLKPGAIEILQWLRENQIPAAVATATDMERTERYLKMLGIYEYFDRLISATMVAEGKPSPDIYLYACAEMGMEPGDCIAVEDSPNGVKSAYRAGCKVVMVPDQSRPDAELEKMLYACFDNLNDLRKISVDN